MGASKRLRLRTRRERREETCEIRFRFYLKSENKRQKLGLGFTIKNIEEETREKGEEKSLEGRR